MITPSNIVVTVVGAGLLYAMLATNPDYNSVVSPFVTKVASGEFGETRLIKGQFDDWKTVDKIAFKNYGKDVERDTTGVFLITNLTVEGTTTSTMINAFWIGSSGRRYAETRRITGYPRQLSDVWLQPGLSNKAVAIFELPPDEVKGGALSLTLRLDPELDGTLLIEAPSHAPEHQSSERLGQ